MKLGQVHQQSADVPVRWFCDAKGPLGELQPVLMKQKHGLIRTVSRRLTGNEGGEPEQLRKCCLNQTELVSELVVR